MNKRQQRQRVHSRFFNEFGKSLDAYHMAVCERILWAEMVFQTSQNATASYDGVSIKNLSFGAKDGLPERVAEAGKVISVAKKCMKKPSLTLAIPCYNVMALALVADWTPVQLGAYVERFTGKTYAARRRQTEGRRVVVEATAPCIDDFNKMRPLK